VPSRCSSRCTWALIADFDSLRRSAAAEKLPQSTTRAKAAMPSRGSIGGLSGFQDSMSSKFPLIDPRRVT
jgi:hypothetical protein